MRAQCNMNLLQCARVIVSNVFRRAMGRGGDLDIFAVAPNAIIASDWPMHESIQLRARRGVATRSGACGLNAVRSDCMRLFGLTRGQGGRGGGSACMLHAITVARARWAGGGGGGGVTAAYVGVWYILISGVARTRRRRRQQCDVTRLRNASPVCEYVSM